MTTPPNSDLPAALHHLNCALAILDGTTEPVIAAKVSDVIDLLSTRLPTPEG
ncbi:hypothetical protein [Sphingomonas sp. R86521]|uniref:hypothetical protein n=1 Tax=Sphingomonas sp. R86521 TaxID=3093860 RepID=UPI0036D30590